MVPVPNTTIVSSSGLGMFRQMSVIGRLGLEEPVLVVTMFTFLSHFWALLPHLHTPLLPFPSSLKYWLRCCC